MKKIITILVCMIGIGVFSSCQNKKAPEASGGSFTPAPIEGMKTVYYDFDESVIRTDQVAVLENNATVAQNNSLQIIIEGHCDERGTNEYNMALGDRRARASKDYLINLSVDPSRINAVSYGEERSVCTQSDESCWWRNRRAEFLKQ